MREDRIFEDPIAAEWFAKLSWPSDLDTWYLDNAQTNLAIRAHDIDQIMRDYSASHVVELGCGLSTRQQRLRDSEIESWVDVDLPEVIALRTQWGVQGGIGKSVTDYSWMDGLQPDLIVAEGLLYYLARDEVDALLAAMRERFSGAALLMDVIGVNDFPALAERTTELGCPIQWKYEGDFADVVGSFGLTEVKGYGPDQLTAEALKRYWHRFDEKLQTGIYFAKNNPTFWAGRSGTILGRL